MLLLRMITQIKVRLHRFFCRCFNLRNLFLNLCNPKDNFFLRRNHGFMLLEVLLSVVIIASGVLFIMRSYVTSIKASEISTRLTKAYLFLEDKLFDIDIKGFREGIEETEDNGSIEGEEDYNWRLVIESLDDEDDKEKINRVDLKTGWKNHIINILTYRKYKKGQS